VNLAPLAVNAGALGAPHCRDSRLAATTGKSIKTEKYLNLAPLAVNAGALGAHHCRDSRLATNTGMHKKQKNM
jgi:hypothetical protein